MKTKFQFIYGGFAIIILAGIIFWRPFSKERGRVEKENISAFGEEEDLKAYTDWWFTRNVDPNTGTIPADIRQKELAFASTIPVHEDYSGGNNSKISAMLTSGQGWTAKGPANVGGRTRALALDVTNSRIVLAGGVSGGMWRSTNGGVTWTKTFTPEQLQTVTCLTQDTRPGKTNIWYCGTGEAIGGFIVAGDGIFKSTDSGKTWVQLLGIHQPQNFVFTDYIWGIITNPHNTTQDEVYMAAIGGIYRSTNGGDSFTEVLGAGLSVQHSSYTNIDISPKGVFYATLSSEGPTGKTGIFRSTDGQNWTNIIPSNFNGVFYRTVTGISPSNENIVYILSSTSGSGFKGLAYNGMADWNAFWKYTYLSGSGDSAGGTWEDRSAYLPAFHEDSGWIFDDFSTQGGYDMVVKVAPNNSNMVYLGGTCLYRSTDAFTSKTNTRLVGGYTKATNLFQQQEYQNHHPDQHNLVFLPSDSNSAYSSCDGGVFKSTDMLADSVHWASLNSNYLTTQFYSVALNPTPKLGTYVSDIIIGGLQDNQTWFNGLNNSPTSPWNQIVRGDGSYCAVYDNDTSTTILGSLQEGHIFKYIFDKNGDTIGWGRVDPIGGANYLFVAPFVLDPNDMNKMYLAAGRYIWRNDSLAAIPLLKNNDSTSIGWEQLVNSGGVGNVSALGISTSPAHVLYFGTSAGRIYKIANAFTGDNTPVNVTPPKISYSANVSCVRGGLMFFGTQQHKPNVSCVAVDPEDANKVIIVYSNYGIISLYYTSNAGTNWVDISGNLEENPDGSGNGPACRWAKIIHTAAGDSLYLVGTSTGLYETGSLNGQQTVWMAEASNSIGNTDVEMMDARLADNIIAVATYGSGIYTCSIDQITGIKNPENQAPSLSLSQNFPNPVSGTTNFSFSLPANEFASLKIYDIQGKEIKVLAQGNMQIGRHSQNANLATLEPGTYFYRLQTNDGAITKKMLVVPGQ